MIVSGGSNVGYSLDSELLSKKLNMETFNTSFSISHDYEFVLNYIASNLQKGDIFLYIPEFDNYYVNNENMMSHTLCVSIYNHPSFFSYLSFTQKVNFLTKVPKINTLLLYKNLKYQFLHTQKSSLQTNSRGDYIHHLDKSKTWKKTEITRYEKYQYNHKLSNHFKNAMLKAQQMAESKGATFYVSYPLIAASQYDVRFKEDLEKFYKNTTIKLIGSPENYIFQDDLIYDHPYHTTKKGREIRTEILIKDLQKVLKL
ncbi:hypothetical protein KORDIASMS9_03606 [Kordia sp. SMS9]|uniref:hypothetical protein n=1 Tax=Kordia sp. SMS9 TaxID=2282170 RepID=UPI000E107819|nr:hypothetical protein [Kordia sp. SMS9]AXG71349.1 hypothetical protein KORDIASMS9_03606 [Kordia sp. SMS9]